MDVVVVQARQAARLSLEEVDRVLRAVPDEDMTAWAEEVYSTVAEDRLIMETGIVRGRSLALAILARNRAFDTADLLRRGFHDELGEVSIRSERYFVCVGELQAGAFILQKAKLLDEVA